MTDMKAFHLLSGGAMTTLIAAVQDNFESENACELQPRFGAVGAMLERFDRGEACDALILSETVMAQLVARGEVPEDQVYEIGSVPTALAELDDVKNGDDPSIDHIDALREALLAATQVYLPDTRRATAGIHMLRVLDRLCIAREVSPKLRAFPNGATAMRAMNEDASLGALGCAQLTEIMATPGVISLGSLPAPCDLAMRYVMGIPTRSRLQQQAVQLVKVLIQHLTAEQRRAFGFMA